MQASTLGWLVIAAIIVIAILFGPRILGELMSRQETARLIRRGADPQHVNPSAQRDDFSAGIGSPWAFNIINGGNKIGRAPAFHNTTVSVEKGLVISQLPDSDFAGEPRDKQYNNATLIGFQGYQPTPTEDVLFQARIQVSPNLYGSAGMMVQPRWTILEDGSFVGPFKNQAFTLFGICFLGPESNLLGQNGATVEKVINWWPVEVQGLGKVDMHELHTYTLRLHWVDEKAWLGTTSVDGQVLSTMELPPFGPLELHVWGDNYKLATSWNGTPDITFQNGEQKWVRFEDVSAWTEAVTK